MNVAVADEVVAIAPLRGLDADHGLAGRDDGPPAHAEKMGDEGLDVPHRALLQRGSGQGMIRLVRAGRHVLEALPDDPQTLPHLLDPHDRARVAVAARGRGDVELELLVAGVGALLPKVPLEAAGPQVRTGHSPLDRLIEGHRSDAHGAGLEYAVLHHDLVVLVEPPRQVT